MNIEEIEIEKLIPYHNNPRKDQAVDKVASSINEYGFQQPIVVDKNMVLIVGHTRLMGAKKLGLKKVPVTIANLSESKAKAYRIADNRLNEDSAWDFDLLDIEIKNLLDDDYNIDLLGFDSSELDKFLTNDEEYLTDEDEVPEPPKEPISKLGDIYQLGEHKLMCGDSLIQNQVEFLLENKTIKLLFTDPPYELTTEGGGVLKKANSMKQIKQNKVDKFEPKNLFLYCKTNIYFHNKPLIKHYIELAEFNKKNYDLCFYKKENVAPNYKGHMMTDVEYIAIIGEQDPNKGLEKEMYSKLFIGKKDESNDLSYSKPVKLCEKFIKLYAEKYVLDLFGGSGSTLIASEKNNKICYIMEKNPIFVDVIIERWENFTGNKAKKIN